MHTNVINFTRPTVPLAAPAVSGETRHDKYINILSKIAIDVTPVATARIAACVVYKNEIVSFGINRLKTHPFQAKFGKNSNAIFLHAETDCIKNALRELSPDDLQRSSLYICRVKYTNKYKERLVFGIAKPCPGCMRAIASFGIRNVFYSCENGNYSQL